MKVVQINSVCGIGSTGRIATDLHVLLKEQGHDSVIAYGRNEARHCDTTIKIGSSLDNYTHVAKTRFMDRHGFGSKKPTEVFMNQLEEINPDIIHLHNIHGYYLNIKVLFNRLKQWNKPVVWTLHDCWSFTGHCAYFDYVGCERWKTGCFSCPQKSSYPSSLKDNSKSNYEEKKEIFNGVKNLTIVTPSEWLAGIVKQSFLKEYPVNVIPNGIDLNVFRPLDNDFSSKIGNKFIVLGVASVWEKRKGLDYFLELSKILPDDMVIVLVGLTEKQINELPKNIIGFTRTNSVKELAELYSSADVFVNPTLEDNFPTTNLEALACGTPVITFNTGGSVESVGNCGYVVEKGDIDGLIQAIDGVKQKGKGSFPCAERAKLYDKTQRFQEYIDLYHKIP